MGTGADIEKDYSVMAGWSSRPSMPRRSPLDQQFMPDCAAAMGSLRDLEKRSYNHRDPADLAALERDLQSLTSIQKASAALLAIEAALFHPLWPVRITYSVSCRIYGCAEATGRIATGISRQFPGVVDGFWRDLMRHMKEGRSTDDPTSAGAWNRRDLQMFLFIVETLGWTPPEYQPAGDEPSDPKLPEAATS